MAKLEMHLWNLALRELWYGPEVAYQDPETKRFYYDWRHDLQDFM